MNTNMARCLLATTITFSTCFVPCQAQETKPDKEGWYSLFDGKTLDGWKAAKFPKAFKVEDGVIVAGGAPLTHLYYIGPVQNARFKNFSNLWTVLSRKMTNVLNVISLSEETR